MEPAELAGLLAREADAGVAGAMAAVESARVITLDHVVARVGAVPGGGEPAWDEVAWQAELHFRAGGAQGPPPAGTSEEVLSRVPAAVAALPVRAVAGVGEGWAERFAGLGVRTVGELAAAAPGVVAAWADELGVEVLRLVARARACAVALPPPEAADRDRRVVDVARTAPDGIRGAALWAVCVTLLGSLDEGAVAGMTVADLRR
ncbi:hypothetical protein [Nostocoides sp. Soil756]|jgi:hypothetical protein|uniref:hypothetical protein n=1 Tax=Nostocoides sp. Soil756 TaxID=1736399 RepID=UPI0006FD1B66|nr:hypothetical protein [Tetrasphaera sp. Soil756]KRE60467.1 hypothetical protein ASG78_14845 [Tetrasphaera sp. Soil756]